MPSGRCGGAMGIHVGANNIGTKRRIAAVHKARSLSEVKRT